MNFIFMIIQPIYPYIKLPMEFYSVVSIVLRFHLGVNL